MLQCSMLPFSGMFSFVLTINAEYNNIYSTAIGLEPGGRGL